VLNTFKIFFVGFGGGWEGVGHYPLITRKRLNEFAEKHPAAKTALQHWYKQAKTNDFKSFAELRKTFGSADQLAI